MYTPLIKQATFNVWTNNTERNHIHVEIKGLGTVSISRTSEGVVVDVFDTTESKVCIDSLVLDNTKFSEGFANLLQAEIKKYDPSIILDQQECCNAYKAKKSTQQFIEGYFQQERFDLNTLSPLKSKAKPFGEQLKVLTRPYIKITDEQFIELASGNADFYVSTGGKVMTFGDADGGYALMHLQDEAAIELMSKESLLNDPFYPGMIDSPPIASLSL